MWILPLLLSIIVAVPCDDEKASPVPFAGFPREYGIEFPPFIKIFYTGQVLLEKGKIDLANDQYEKGHSISIPIDHPAVSLEEPASDFDVKVSSRLYDGIRHDGIKRRLVDISTKAQAAAQAAAFVPIIKRHPELELESIPRTVVLNTSHQNLSSSIQEMIRIPGNFRVRLGNMVDCSHTLVPFTEFGFSTLPWIDPGTIQLLNVGPATETFPDWPKSLSLQFSAPIMIHDLRQIRYEITSLQNPKDTQVFPFDRVSSSFGNNKGPIGGDKVFKRRLLGVGVPPTPETPCLSFCERNPMSEACSACCTGVVHEKPWNCGDDSSQVKCCTEWSPDCWDTPSDKNLLHSCNLCENDSRASYYEFSKWISIEDNVLTLDHQALVDDLEFSNLRKVLLRTNVLVKLVLGRGAIVDGFAKAQPAAPASLSFRVVREVPQLQLSNTLAGRAMPTLPDWINFTIQAPAAWRCPTDMRGFGIRHKDLAGGQVMRPGDLCRFQVARDDPNTESPTPEPTTSSPGAVPTPVPPSTFSPTLSPITYSPTYSPTPMPTAGPSTPSPTLAPTTSPTIAAFAPREVPCDRDEFWPDECPFPRYLHLVVERNVTTLAVDTNHFLFKQDFPSLDRVRGQITVTVDQAALIATDGTSSPIEISSPDPYFVIAPHNSAGLALTSDGLRVNRGQNTVIFPAGAISDAAVVETSIVTPQLPPGIPAPISDIVRIVVLRDNDTVADMQNLQAPVQIVLPIPQIKPQVATTWSPCQKQAYYHLPTCVWWNEAHNDWSTGGCFTDNSNASETICICNHLTDFAVLQALESCQEVDPLPYQVFAGPFFCVFLYCLWAIAMLLWYRQETHKPGFGSLAGQHTLIAIAAMTRALGPLAVLPDTAIGTTVLLFAIPYLAKFPSFLLLVFQWATVVHFTMQSGGGRKRMMPAFAVFCALIDLTVVGLFVYFYVTAEVSAVLAGTIALAGLAGLFALAFLGYAYYLAKQFPKDLSSSSSTTRNNNKRLGLRFRVQLGGVSFAFLFMLEAACHPTALYLQQQQQQNGAPNGLLAMTCVFLLAEFLSFVVILWLFRPALHSFFMPKATTTTETELTRSASNVGTSFRKSTAV